jgi:hypothetical protein
VAIACPITLPEIETMDADLESVRSELGRMLEYGAAAPEVAMYWSAKGAAYRKHLDEYGASEYTRRDIDLWRTNSMEAAIALAEGRTADSRRHAELAYAAGADSWNHTAIAIHAYMCAFNDRLDGRPDRSIESLRELTDSVGGPVVRLLHTWVAAEAGDRPYGAYVLTRMGADRLMVLPEFFLGSMALAAVAGTALAIGDPAWMEVAYRAMSPIEGQLCGVAWAPLPAADHYLGLLATRLERTDAAARHFERAASLHERFGASGFAAYSRQVCEGNQRLSA